VKKHRSSNKSSNKNYVSKSGGGGSSGSSQVCPYHLKQYVAFCIIHNELVCEECCDLSHHRDHNNQILLLKAAAQNFIQKVDTKLDAMVQNRT
jgi:hypothetical protein